MEVSPRENTCVVIDIPDLNIVSEGHTACSIVDLSESGPVTAPQVDSYAIVDIPDLSSPGQLFHLLVLI